MASREQRLKIGTILVIFAGLFAFTMGVTQFLSAHRAIGDTSQELFPPGFDPVTLDDLNAQSAHLGAHWVLTSIIAWVNLTFTGFTLILMAWFGLRKAQKWGWGFVLLVWSWVGLNDLFGVILFYKMTEHFLWVGPLIPVSLAATGLILSFPAVFRRSEMVPARNSGMAQSSVRA